jgi:DNA-directed RNA polymerase specialized sigma subunit
MSQTIEEKRRHRMGFYDLQHAGGMTRKEVAAELGISEDRVAQIERRAIYKLRKLMGVKP